MSNVLATTATALGIALTGTEVLPADGTKMLIELATQWGPLGLFALALWHILAGRDKQIEKLQDQLALIREQAREDVRSVVAAIERGTASNERLTTEIRELKAELIRRDEDRD